MKEFSWLKLYVKFRALRCLGISYEQLLLLFFNCSVDNDPGVKAWDKFFFSNAERWLRVWACELLVELRGSGKSESEICREVLTRIFGDRWVKDSSKERWVLELIEASTIADRLLAGEEVNCGESDNGSS